VGLCKDLGASIPLKYQVETKKVKAYEAWDAKKACTIPQRQTHMNPAEESNSNRLPKAVEWTRIANSAQFQHLLAVKRSFIIPVFVFFLAYYLLLPVLVGYAPRLMSTRVVGTVTVAYLFALSQFVVGWTIAWWYLRASSRFDRLVKDLLEHEGHIRGER
jgi:uncharacterized membrane protein (DUF485 family)